MGQMATVERGSAERLVSGGDKFEFGEREMDRRRSTVFSHILRLRSVCFLHSHIRLVMTFRSRVPVLCTTVSQFPAIIKAITFSNFRDANVIEKTE